MRKALIGVLAGFSVLWCSAAIAGEASGLSPLQGGEVSDSVEDTAARVTADFGSGPDSREAAVVFLREHSGELSRCILPGVFFQAAEKAEPGALAFDTYEKLMACDLPAELHRGVLEKLAWHYYNGPDLDRAEALFTRLQQEDPDHSGAAVGLGYIRLNTGRAAEALAALEAGGTADTAEVLALKKLVYVRVGWERYEGGDFGGAKALAGRALDIQPDDPDTLVLMAWSSLKGGDADRAMDIFEAIAAEAPTPENLTQLMDAQLEADRYLGARDTAEKMAASQSPELRERAADFFFQHGEPVHAAELLPADAAVCYRNADAPVFDSEIYLRSRDGDRGTSRLYESALSLDVRFPLKPRILFSAGLTSKRIGSGSGGVPIQTGSYYYFLDNDTLQTGRLDKYTVTIPRVEFFTEGETRWSLRLGTTPLGGTVSATPTGELSLETDRWYLALERCSVTESVLSTIGLEDPYTGGEWGRVVRSGVSAGATWNLKSPYWISADAGAGVYTGEHVKKNESVDANLSAGGTWQLQGGAFFSGGLFLYAEHFTRNSNFFTFGHGGYYSPDLLTMLGPFVNYRTPECRQWQLDLQASVGWLYKKTGDSPRYPLYGEDASLFGIAAAEELAGVYQGTTENDLGYSVSAEGWYFLTDRLAFGGTVKGEQSSNYAEFLAAVGLRWFFEGQAGFWQSPFRLTQVGSCWNR